MAPCDRKRRFLACKGIPPIPAALAHRDVTCVMPTPPSSRARARSYRRRRSSAAPSAPAERELFEYAVDLAQRAGDLTLRWFRAEALAVERKSDGSPVTEADREA